MNMSEFNLNSSSLLMDVASLPEADPVMERIFVISIITLTTLGTVCMGCDLEVQIVLETLKRPTAPLIGFFTQFMWMPLLSYAIANFMLVPYDEYPFALGLFVTGCSPGGGASNFWTYLLGGNVHLSITMTFLSTMASFVMVLFWMQTLGHQFLKGFTKDVAIKIPYRNIAYVLTLILFPLMIGVAIARYRPTWATNLRKILKPFSIIFLVFAIVVGTFTYRHIFGFITWSAVFSGVLLSWCGFMFGCFTALLLRQKPEDVTAIAIETGVQNTGIAIALLKLSFDKYTADISMLMPVIFACSIPGPLLIGYAVHHTVQKLRRRRETKTQLAEVVELSPSSHTKHDTQLESRDSHQPVYLGVLSN
ncbi:hypothetical protein M3Y95_00467100 [Aphelenchoides besseyi]|nr:hypothetical protein M3Y95_00467100 [Aphelenchoides besseyi]